MKHLIFTLLILCVFLNPVHAGSQSKSQARFSAEEISRFAKQVEIYAANRGAMVFLISRLGQPQKNLPEGIEFTHTAIAVYSDIQLTNGETVKGYAIHNLYQKEENPKRSLLVTDYPVDFFWGVHELKAGISIPSRQLQHKLITAITNDYPKKLHNPRYSLIANPFNNKYQNCTEHVLNVINAAIYETTNMAQIKVNTRAYFTPQKVSTSRFKLALGGIFMDGVRTSDHKGKIATTTFSSITRYLANNDLLQHTVILTPDRISELTRNEES